MEENGGELVSPHETYCFPWDNHLKTKLATLHYTLLSLGNGGKGCSYFNFSRINRLNQLNLVNRSVIELILVGDRK